MTDLYAPQLQAFDATIGVWTLHPGITLYKSIKTYDLHVVHIHPTTLQGIHDTTGEHFQQVLLLINTVDYKEQLLLPEGLATEWFIWRWNTYKPRYLHTQRLGEKKLYWVDDVPTGLRV